MYKIVKLTCVSLVIIGALNWGLVGLFNFDLVAKLFGEMSALSRLVYSLVGLSGFILILMAPSCYAKHKDEF